MIVNHKLSTINQNGLSPGCACHQKSLALSHSDLRQDGWRVEAGAHRERLKCRPRGKHNSAMTRHDLGGIIITAQGCAINAKPPGQPLPIPPCRCSQRCSGWGCTIRVAGCDRELADASLRCCVHLGCSREKLYAQLARSRKPGLIGARAGGSRPGQATLQLGWFAGDGCRCHPRGGGVGVGGAGAGGPGALHPHCQPEPRVRQRLGQQRTAGAGGGPPHVRRSRKHS